MGRIHIVPSTPDTAAAVLAFNERLAAAGITYRLTPASAEGAAPSDDGAPQLEHYVAVDDEGMVRGGYSLQYQEFMVGGTSRRVAFYKLPLSEGLIDPRFAAVGVSLVRHTLKQEPRLFVLGIGGRHEALARLLTSWRWPLEEVPFYFRLLRAPRALRTLSRLHGGRVGAALRVAYASGAGAVVGAVTSAWARVRRPPALRAELVPEFGDWTDEIWDANRTRASFIARRDRRALQAWYGAHPRVLRYRLTRRGRPIGWAVALDTQMQDHRDFGDLRVGTIVDALALPAHETAATLAVTTELAQRGVDLVLSNQAGRAWRHACVQAGYLRGPSRFLFGAAPALRDTIGRQLADMHLTRGDGDGPLHL